MNKFIELNQNEMSVVSGGGFGSWGNKPAVTVVSDGGGTSWLTYGIGGVIVGAIVVSFGVWYRYYGFSNESNGVFI